MTGEFGLHRGEEPVAETKIGLFLCVTEREEGAVESGGITNDRDCKANARLEDGPLCDVRDSVLGAVLCSEMAQIDEHRAHGVVHGFLTSSGAGTDWTPEFGAGYVFPAARTGLDTGKEEAACNSARAYVLPDQDMEAPLAHPLHDCGDGCSCGQPDTNIVCDQPVTQGQPCSRYSFSRNCPYSNEVQGCGSFGGETRTSGLEDCTSGGETCAGDKMEKFLQMDWAHSRKLCQCREGNWEVLVDWTGLPPEAVKRIVAVSGRNTVSSHP